MIRVVVDDIAFVRADAVVRPATATLEPTTAALRSLEQVGGPAFGAQLRVQQDLAVGAAVVTAAGDLPAEFVVHAIIRSVTEPVSAAGVRRALTSTMQRAVDWQLARLSLPLVGTGAGGLALEEAAGILCEVLNSHLSWAAYPREVCIVVEREEERQLVEGLLRRMP
ncbi:MAG: macro domain-containing protein [Gemmatimonadetes bacterium]|nr:macro domain-containing protein [Gemmatimonadota bacterium]